MIGERVATAIQRNGAANSATRQSPFEDGSADPLASRYPLDDIPPLDGVPSLSVAVQTENSYSAEELENISIYDRFNEGVVNITTETIAYNWFLEPLPQRGNSGSGSIIDEDGYVLTNGHVVEGARRVFVTLANGNRFEGDVVGSDTENDLAVIRFYPGDTALTTIPMGRSDNLKVGIKVLAIGNPFGLSRTLTTGIISGLGRPVRVSSNLVVSNMIQTDAAINPGNSGGPLLDIRGNIIGVNTAIFSPSGGSVGIGFAVPINTARRVVPDLIRYGIVRRGWIEIIPRQIFSQLAQYANLPVRRGILISQTVSGGNAEKAGLMGGSSSRRVRYGRTYINLGGDIITSVNGIATDTIANLYEALEGTNPGDRVEVVFYRGATKMQTTVELSERPTQFEWE